MRRIKLRFIAIHDYHRIPRLMRELAETLGDKAPCREELLKLAKELNEIPHWFEAEFIETPSRSLPGRIERFRVPGTLKDCGPVKLQELQKSINCQLRRLYEPPSAAVILF